MPDRRLLEAKILIVDDDDYDLQVLHRILRQEGYEATRTTTDPLAALDLLHDFQPDLVVMDWRMPGLDGAKMLSRLQAAVTPGTHLPILVVTGDPLIETRREALSCGASDIVSKPYDRIEIMARIGNLLERRFRARDRAEEAMREGELRFFDTFEHAPIGVALVSPEGRWLKVNRALCELVGYSEEELLVRTFQDITHPEDLAGNQEHLRRLITGGIRAYQAEKRYLHRNGDTLTVLLNVSLVSDGLGQPQYFIAQIQDMTGRKKVEEELSQSREALRRLNADLEERVAQRTEDLFLVTQEAELANRAKSEFLSRTSHELRTPMNAILGFGQLLEMEENLDPGVREGIVQILGAGRHLLALIDEILDISNAESGAMMLPVEPVAVDQAVEETFQRIQPLGATFQIDLESRWPEGRQWRVMANPLRLKQVLHNLLSNAIQYNLAGGKVVLQCGPFEASDPPMFRFSVKDTGPGIRAEYLPRLFTPFDRLDAERARIHVAGSGLGLAVSKRLVELMGGSIGVESVVGRGSTFWFELPRAELPTAPADADTPPATTVPDEPIAPAADLARPTIADAPTLLYIEDNLSNLRLMTRILDRRPAVRLFTATTGEAGLRMAREYVPHLILLDLRLADMNGAQVLAGLRADPRTSKIPVVILSADGPTGKSEEMLTAGARAFLTKPVDVRTVLDVLDRFLGVRPGTPG